MKDEVPSVRNTAQRIAGLPFLYFILIVFISIGAFPLLDNNIELFDFGSFYASGLKAQKGENPYDPNSEYIFEIVFQRVGAGGKMMNLNPPISVILFRPLANFDPFRTIVVWQIVAATFYLSSVFLLGAGYRHNVSLLLLLWSFSLAGFWHTLGLGQVYTFLLLLTSIGWVLHRSGKVILAGISIGLVVAIKPNFAVWLLFLWVWGYRHTVVASSITFLVVSMLPLMTYGVEIYRQWLEASQPAMETLIMPGNNSMVGLTARFGSAEVGIVISLLLVAGLLLLVRSRKAQEKKSFEEASALGIIASLLASPISWTGYTIMLLPIFFSLKEWSPRSLASAAVLTIPFGFVLRLFQASHFGFVVFGWLYGWAILLLLWELVRNIMITRSIQTN